MFDALIQHLTLLASKRAATEVVCGRKIPRTDFSFSVFSVCAFGHVAAAQGNSRL